MALETLEFKDEDESVGPFRRRLFFVFSLVALCFLILACRLAWLQIINRDLYVERAEQNRTVTTTSQGSRGLIFDRNGTLLAGNRLSWSLEVTSSQTAEPVEQLFDRLAEIIPITSADRRRYRRLRENFNRYDSVPIRTDLTDEEVAVFAAQRWRFQGLELNQREHRIYPEGAVGSHFLGYVGALSLNDKKRLDAAGDLALYQGEREIGKVGLERSYEKTLHGTPGHEILEVSAGGRPVRTLELEAAQPGSNLTLTIDLNLQRVAEKAMTGKTGSVIAIEPKTGRILAFASLPTYDPNLFPGGIDPESWNYLNTAEEKPLLNRAMRGIYPIGSTYKPFMALAGLELGAVTADYVLNDTAFFKSATINSATSQDLLKVYFPFANRLPSHRIFTTTGSPLSLESTKFTTLCNSGDLERRLESILSENRLAFFRVEIGRKHVSKSLGMSEIHLPWELGRATTPLRSYSLHMPLQLWPIAASS